MFEKYLIDHCAPTLASLKTGSLFNLPLSETDDLREQTQRWNRELGEKGITLYILRHCKHGVLIYVCRKSRLEKELSKPEVQRFLSGYGYCGNNIDCAIHRLEERLRADGSFPHEIGVFLGYPLDDVKGFIENAGKNAKCTGCWKVYHNECEAIRTFQKYKKCRDVYSRLCNKGISVRQLTVAV